VLTEVKTRRGAFCAFADVTLAAAKE